MRSVLLATPVVLFCLAVACGGDDTSDSGSGGSSNTGGVSGGSGTSGSGGSGAQAGTGGSAGTGGTAGAGGGAGTAGSAGTAGAAGAAGSGGAGGASGGGAGAAGTGGVIGTGGAPNDKLCQKLNADYIKALPAAKKCKYGTTPEPCSSKIKGDLSCQCPTFVNPANTAAIAELTKIENEWKSKGCKPSLTCLCANPPKGTCYAGPGGPADGLCSDN